MRPPEAVTAAAPADTIGVEQAEAALVEHYTRLVRIAYLVLPPSLGRNRRVLTAHALVQRALPRRRTACEIPGPRGARNRSYVFVRGRVLRQALEAGRSGAARLPPLLPRVWGLRLFPRSGGADELALDQMLSRLSGAARAAYALRGLEQLPDDEVRHVLVSAGADDPDAALADAHAVEPADAVGLLYSPEFDPCSLQARPSDLLRRRQFTRAALAATAAVLVCGTLLGLPGAAPARPYARNPAAEAALDPAKVLRSAPGAWRTSARTDFSVWPARGPLTGDHALLRRALTAWSDGAGEVSATPGTPSGPPMGPPQLLYAGAVDGARAVLFHDGLRVVRYAESMAPSARGGAPVALDFARVDDADGPTSAALVVSRSDDNVRYLTAPWIGGTSVRDLRDDSVRPLRRDADGVTDPMPSPALAGGCGSWDTLQVRDGTAERLLTDLGELAPARLTSGPPSAPADVSSPADRATWARTACMLLALRADGVRSVNSWTYARQSLPEANGTAGWVCTRAETWRGPGSRVLAQFQEPSKKQGALAAKAEDSTACGEREPQVLAGVLWKSHAGHWYLLAGGSPQFRALAVTGTVRAESKGPLLAVRTEPGARASLNGVTTTGTRTEALR
ncbi:hypothetical protein [Streptomyces sp. NPDC088725]|uniref:hypothetical protein n=1 Tax=Streptomyces sp. NPDC088725 TaxID=3365873 RepID=UPI00382E1A59